MQILARGPGVGLESALGFFRLRGFLFPVAVEELVHERGDLRELFLAELPRENRRHVLDHAAALRLVDRVRRRADEEELRLLLAVLVVEREIDLDRFVAVGADPLERRFERAVEAAADLAGPAHGEQKLRSEE